MQPVEEMIGEVDDVGGGSASWSREDPMTQSDKLHDEQSGLTKKASDSDDERQASTIKASPVLRFPFPVKWKPKTLDD